MKPRGNAWIGAEQAVERLGVSRATLYAYVSRGRIRSEPVPGEARRRRYSSEDIDSLLARTSEHKDPGKAATQALHFGLPVLESAITLIAGGRLYYRGHDATELAATRSVSEVAALIWTGDFETESLGPLQPKVRLPRLTAEMPFIARAQSMLASASVTDPAAYDLRELAVIRSGWRIVTILARAAAGRAGREREIETLLANAWHVARGKHLIRSALILCADHELNVSAFTARCVASAGTSPYGVVIAGLAALEGYKHGGTTERVDALWDSLIASKDLERSLEARLRRGEPIEGFGHPLYPEGDPRTVALLGALPRTHEMEFARRVIEAARAVLGEHPNVDFALVAMARALKLPHGSALTLFALGRSIGWIAQAIEQYASDTIIRPRAKYVGNVPGVSPSDR
jgi:citrate synthase